jgi:hypothetical protein
LIERLKDVWVEENFMVAAELARCAEPLLEAIERGVQAVTEIDFGR